ncbi:XVIPCD domain-containing protein [Xanthomonas sp. 3793]|uniref:XVIPCD domain-containing protein n=1 Tax=Xanthomonas sp. 10-10 TaxID=3115848 RepID=A0AAU7P9D6_9XANT|nr:XVIPCD domain-containing protein [Xanthomonas sp. 3793]MCS3748420.1 molybdopterin converting factor small subunit [Xanthomonas sp. 3793]
MTAEPVVDQGPVGPDHPEHPDHYLFAQIREAVGVLDAELDKPTDEASVRMAARLLPLAKQHGFDQVDYVVLSRHLGEVGENVFLVRGELSDPAHLRAHITTQEAMETSVETSMAQLDEINRRLMLRLPPR